MRQSSLLPSGLQYAPTRGVHGLVRKHPSDSITHKAINELFPIAHVTVEIAYILHGSFNLKTYLVVNLNCEIRGIIHRLEIYEGCSQG